VSDGRAVNRNARERGRYLARTSELTDREARVLAYSELGFSASGIAKRTGHTTGTVERYLERIAVRYGHGAIEPRREDEREGRPDEARREEILGLSQQSRQWWLDAVNDHREIAPAWAVELVDERGRE